jgi:hypothetical protein
MTAEGRNNSDHRRPGTCGKKQKVHSLKSATSTGICDFGHVPPQTGSPTYSAVLVPIIHAIAIFGCNAEEVAKKI